MKHPLYLSQLLSGQLSAQDIPHACWVEVLEQARSAQVMGILYSRLAQRDQLCQLESSVKNHLISAWRVFEKYHRDTLWEVDLLSVTLQKEGIVPVFLKGAAYALNNDVFAMGRTFSDIDLLVSRSDIDRIEELLYWHGWQGTHHNDYDQRYYREWMHEIPPLVHVKRHTVLDIHHTILPLTACFTPNAEALMSSSRLCQRGYRILSLHDQILHASTHLFTDSEYNHAYRDLVDIDGLLRQCGETESWELLLDRACLHDLCYPLYFAITHAKREFDTPVPPDLFDILRDKLAINRSKTAFLNKLLDLVIVPPHPSAMRAGYAFAERLLFIRGHSLRMPFKLLCNHLSYKLLFSKEKNS